MQLNQIFATFFDHL